MRGIGLANTLVVMAIVAILAFTVSAVSLSHLSFAARLSNGRQAQNVAESTLAVAVKELLQDDRYGKSGETLDLTPFAGARGRLTFSPQTASQWSLDYSTNNLQGPNPVSGSRPDQPVPRSSAQLVATGSYRGVTRRVEMVLYVPPFPYAIASAAPFRSSGDLEVGAVSDAGELTNLDPEALLAADLATNASGVSALVLGPNTRIAGNVRSAGEVKLDPGALVRGEVKSYSDPVQIPKEDVRSYDPESLGKPNLQKLTPGPVDAPVYQGFVKSPGDLTVTNGLRLDNGVLYVDGNLSVTGGVQGTGAIFVTGKTSLLGGAHLTTDNTVALMSIGDVTLSGLGKLTSSFQGLLYTEGSLRAQQMSLLGVFIQSNPNAVVDISDSTLVYVPEYGQVEVQVKPTQVSLLSANVLLTRDGQTFSGEYGDNGPVVFEAYPITTGGWELVDPNAGTITHYDKVDEVGEAIHQMFHKAQHGGGGLVGIKDDSGEARSYSVNLDYHKQIKPNVISQLAGVPPRAPQSSGVLPPKKAESFKIDPSRFLSLKDRARIVYWRAR